MGLRRWGLAWPVAAVVSVGLLGGMIARHPICNPLPKDALPTYGALMADSRIYLLSHASGEYAEAVWRPPVDIYRCDHGWLIKCDLAGVRRDEVSVQVSGRRLTIAGNRRDLTIAEGHRAYSLEISYNRFERVLELPADLAPADVNVEYRDGMLLVMLTSSETAATPKKG